MTEKKKSPAFQFYPDEWLTDREVAMMTPEQEGGYIRLVCFCWLDNDISLPDDDEQLSVLARLNKGGLKLVKAKFKQHPTKEGFLTHARLQKEYKKQVAWREKSARGGRKSKKPSKQDTDNKDKNKGGVTKEKPKGNTPSPSPSPTVVKEKKKEVYTLEFLQFWDSWKIHKTGKGSKQDASPIYEKAAKDIGHEEIIRSSEEYCRFCKATDCNTKHIFRWLTKRGWEDDYAIPEKEPSNDRECYSSQIINAASRAEEKLQVRGNQRNPDKNCITGPDTGGNEDGNLLPPPCRD